MALFLGTHEFAAKLEGGHAEISVRDSVAEPIKDLDGGGGGEGLATNRAEAVEHGTVKTVAEGRHGS